VNKKLQNNIKQENNTGQTKLYKQCARRECCKAREVLHSFQREIGENNQLEWFILEKKIRVPKVDSYVIFVWKL